MYTLKCLYLMCTKSVRTRNKQAYYVQYMPDKLTPLNIIIASAMRLQHPVWPLETSCTST
jgi:hypothetical protein